MKLNHSIEIDGRVIGDRTFVIAEIGVNHDGDVGRALSLVDAAAEAGANAVKFQAFEADRLAGAAPRAAYQGAGDQASLLAGLELTAAELERATDHARDRGLVPIVTPFSPEDVALLAYLSLPAVKIGSADLVNDLLLRACAGLGVPVILSTGASTPAEIDHAAGLLRGEGVGFALMHCVSAYPTPDAAANLVWIGELKRWGACVGYSDHTQHADAGALAVAAGAVLIEKHLTYDRAAEGPDHAASFAPAQFAEYVRRVRSAEVLVGGGPRKVLDDERDVRTVSRQSLVLARDVPAGAVLRAEDLTTRRPGTGVSPARLDEVVGRRAATALVANDPIAMDMLHATAAA